MRFIYKILIGLILFNAMLLINAIYFPASSQTVEEGNVVDVTGSTSFTQYRGFTGYGVLVDAISTGAAVFSLTIVLGLVSRNLPLFIGVGSFMAILSGLWIGTTGIFTKMFVDYNTVGQLYVVVTIIIGVVGTFSVIEIFTGQAGAD